MIFFIVVYPGFLSAVCNIRPPPDNFVQTPGLSVLFVVFFVLLVVLMVRFALGRNAVALGRLRGCRDQRCAGERCQSQDKNEFFHVYLDIESLMFLLVNTAVSQSLTV
jgi:hypothetical protein